MRVRFLADANLNNIIVTGVLRREPSVDFQTALSAGLRGLPDSGVLALAAASGRVLVTHDVNTMPAHFRVFRELGNTSSGVFLVPQHLEIASAIEELLLIWVASDSEDWENRLEWLPL